MTILNVSLKSNLTKLIFIKMLLLKKTFSNKKITFVCSGSQILARTMMINVDNNNHLIMMKVMNSEQGQLPTDCTFVCLNVLPPLTTPPLPNYLTVL